MNLLSSDTAHQPSAFENMEYSDSHKLHQTVKIHHLEVQLNNVEKDAWRG